MRNPKRIKKILKAIEKIWEKHPDLRLGQLIWNSMAGVGKWNAPEANPLFFIEDEDLEKMLKKQNQL